MKKAIAIITSFLCVSGLFAQDSISTIILSMPDKIIEGLEASHKELLVSSPKDTATLTISTTLYPAIKRTYLSDDYIRIETSGAGEVQIKLLPLINDSKIICVISTVCGQICDSNIKFYTTEWKPIETSTLYPGVNLGSFVKPGVDAGSDAYKNAVSALDMNPVKLTFSPTENVLTLEYDIKPYLAEGDYERLEPYLTEEPVTLTWDKVSFK